MTPRPHSGSIVCYISGHGFGHAVRVIEVLRALWRVQPDLCVCVRTVVPPWFFQGTLDGPYTYAACQLDVGAIQRDSLTVDVEATLQAYADIVRRKQALVVAEAAALSAFRPRLIVADIPALAFDVAAALSVPAVAMTNFSWDWIYADYVRDLPDYAPLVDDLRASYGRATLLLRLPFHGDLTAFPTIRDVPLVARHATVSETEVRRQLQLPGNDRLVLLSFGGIGVALQAAPTTVAGVTYVATQSAGLEPPPSGCRFIRNAELDNAGIGYEDLVAACDVVMTKPGYGIVSDCIANGTPMIYTSRGRFAEYECLVNAIRMHLPHAFISNEDLYAGRWQSALQHVLGQTQRTTAIATNGAEVVAATLLSLI